MAENPKKKKLEEGLRSLFSTPAKPAAASATIEQSAPQPIAAPPAPPKPVVVAVAQPVAAPPAPATEPVKPADVPVSAAEIINPVAAHQSTVFSEERQLVLFTLAGEFYGLDIAVVEQIIKLQNITPVPYALPFVEGVTNLRGTVLSVLDLRTRFGMPKADNTRESRIVVVETHNAMIGLVVDEVTEVLRISVDLIEPPSSFVATLDSAFITGIARLKNKLVILLDLDKIFMLPEVVEK